MGTAEAIRMKTGITNQERENLYRGKCLMLNAKLRRHNEIVRSMQMAKNSE
ncbi:MAG TPA: hypothetical protein VLH56_10225 [Dissulfurispiraceae bacterium]|nr:hypothetical protein [Dissulfurispiraceae bacterium]